jgi:uncharacterized cupredoxin-like copper-binding protein
MLGSRRKALGVGLLAVIALVTALALTTTGSAKSGQSLKLKASPSGALRFDRKKLTAHAGKATIVMTNPKSSGLTHGIEVEGKGLEKRGKNARPGHATSVTVRLKKGTYKFYCPVDGHRAAGMRGTIVVK